MQTWVHVALLCMLVLYLLLVLWRVWRATHPHHDSKFAKSHWPMPVTHSTTESFNNTTTNPNPNVDPQQQPPAATLTSVLRFGEVRDTARKQQQQQQQTSNPGTDNSHRAPTIQQRFEAAKKTVPEDRLTKGVLTQKERIDRLNTMIRRPQTSAKRRQWRDQFRDYFRGDPVPGHKDENARLRNDGQPLPGALTCNKRDDLWGGSSSTPVGGSNEPEQDGVFMQD